jgi:serine/threonine protein kinase
MDAGTLQDLILAGVCCQEPILASIAHSVLKGLDFLHTNRKVHRDIKASNILISKDG